MTPELATALMAQLDRVAHRTPFKWRNVATDGTHGTVTVITLADKPTVGKWFSDAGMCATRFDRDCKAHAWVVTFQVMERGEEKL